MALQAAALAASVAGAAVAVTMVAQADRSAERTTDHKVFGIVVLVVALAQFVAGAKRPGKPKQPGDAPSRARRAFELGHRGGGWALLVLAFFTMRSGARLAAADGYLDATAPYVLAFALPMGATLAVVVVYLARASLLAKRSKADAAAAAAPPAAPGAGDGGTVEMTTSAAGSQF